MSARRQQAQAITGQTGQTSQTGWTRRGRTQACLPALPAYLTYLGLLACRFFFPSFCPPTPRHRLCPQHNNITDQRQLVNSLLDLHTSRPNRLPSLFSTPPDFLSTQPFSLAPFRKHIQQNGERGMLRVVLQPLQAHPHSPLCSRNRRSRQLLCLCPPAPDSLPSPVSPACCHLPTYSACFPCPVAS